jgi:hypothetical protein
MRISAQITPDQERIQQTQSGNNPNSNNDLSGSENGQNSMTNEAGPQDERPRTGRPLQPTIIRHVGTKTSVEIAPHDLSKPRSANDVDHSAIRGVFVRNESDNENVCSITPRLTPGDLLPVCNTCFGTRHEGLTGL